MKKIILSTILMGLIASSASAANTETLTRTVNKLILSQSKVILKINTVNDNLKKQDSEDKSLKKMIILNEEKIKSNTKNINLNKQGLDKNSKDIKNILSDLPEIKNTAAKAIVMSKDTRDILNNISKISKEVNLKAGEVSEKSKDINETTTKLKISIINIQSKVSSLEKSSLEYKNQIRSLNKEVKDLKNQIKNNKDIELNHYKELSQKIDSMKIFYEGEIKLIKAKMESLRPVVLMKDSNCGTDKVKCSTDIADQSVIDNFLK